MKLVYLIGEPGAGKSTAVREALADYQKLAQRSPFAHEILMDKQQRIRGAHLGESYGTFPGTDRLSMSVQPRVLAWLEVAKMQYPFIIGEGDRLGNGKFFNAVMDRGIDLTILHLTTPAAAQRRAQREGTQSESWLKGRQSKVNKLADEFEVIRIDSTLTPEMVGAAVKSYIM